MTGVNFTSSGFQKILPTFLEEVRTDLLSLMQSGKMQNTLHPTKEPSIHVHFLYPFFCPSPLQRQRDSPARCSLKSHRLSLFWLWCSYVEVSGLLHLLLGNHTNLEYLGTLILLILMYIICKEIGNWVDVANMRIEKWKSGIGRVE